jgi:hypothetical protein
MTVVALRMYGGGLTLQTLAEVAFDALPWTLAGMVMSIGSGLLLFASAACKYYGNWPFLIKMGLLLTGILSSGG